MAETAARGVGFGSTVLMYELRQDGSALFHLKHFAMNRRMDQGLSIVAIKIMGCGLEAWKIKNDKGSFANDDDSL